MADYVAPLQDMRFVLKNVIGLETVNTLPPFTEVTEDVVDAILEEAARFAQEVLSPLNAAGDRAGSVLKEGNVTTPSGFREAYRQFVAAGWGNMAVPGDAGGQGLPMALANAAEEMWGSANIAFKLCPMLTLGAIEALHANASPELQQRFLPKMVSGEWTGTMNLTEPQAGSDLSLVNARATPQADGTYRITGQKIFITYGEHDFTDNIVHAVLARIDGAPPGVKGISLFVVPKVQVRDDGSLGERNAVRCIAIEHKLGIRASPTAVLSYEDAVGHLVGEAHHGLEYMFIMMNAARLSVGLEGVCACERAYQAARGWARDRLQGKPSGVAGAGPMPIDRHPDVRRMLLTMKALGEAGRALAYQAAVYVDRSRHHPDEAERRRCQALVDLLTPVVKGWCTEVGVEAASLGIQVHGGMGFIEETGAAQILRDARIATIYEGTTGIQANDLVGRKTAREGGRTMAELSARMQETASALAGSADADLQAIGKRLAEGIAQLSSATRWIVDNAQARPLEIAAGAVAYLKLSGYVMGGWMMARSADVAVTRLAQGDGDLAFLEGKRATARFYAEHLLSQSAWLAQVVMHGGESVLVTDAALG